MGRTYGHLLRLARLILYKLLMFVVVFAGPKTISQGQAFISYLDYERPSGLGHKDFLHLENAPRYWEEILMAAREYGLDPLLIEAIIQVESNFDPGAVSPRGAVGLMQVSPLVHGYKNQASLLDPQENIMTGARHLRDLLDAFGGDLRLALAAYNAGATRVREFEGIPPFPETKTYIRKVMRYMEAKRSAGTQGVKDDR